MSEITQKFINLNDLFYFNKDLEYINSTVYTDDKLSIYFKFHKEKDSVNYLEIKDINKIEDFHHFIFHTYSSKVVDSNYIATIKELTAELSKYQYIIDIHSYEKIDFNFLKEHIKNLNINIKYYKDFTDIFHNLLYFTIPSFKKEELKELLNDILKLGKSNGEI